ncbi:hypothetical protein LS71_004660 [Helicobacter jaachi]|uniref:Alpha-1,2-fucosyltransferase n=1 Tax=Helicobacter jaachi TaxID=1677920 RepID=A0A4U8TDY9_9HELI|nr:hypothetical protein [Helicobacter jaachi]TLD96887.1 hypothetical protein LS71_004660 [Helicobacter jaachi]
MIVQIVGGLGNQMFIYAFAKALEARGYDVLLDVTSYAQHTESSPTKSATSHSIESKTLNGGGGATRF